MTINIYSSAYIALRRGWSAYALRRIGDSERSRIENTINHSMIISINMSINQLISINYEESIIIYRCRNAYGGLWRHIYIDYQW